MTHNSPEKKPASPVSPSREEKQEGVFYPEDKARNCCEKCGDVHFEKTYPAHTAYYACTNLKCDCHALSQEKLPSPRKEEQSFCAVVDEGTKMSLVSVDGDNLTVKKEELIRFQDALKAKARASTLKEVGEILVGLEKTVFLPLPENAKEFMGDFERGTVGAGNYAIREAIAAVAALQDKKLP